MTIDSYGQKDGSMVEKWKYGNQLWTRRQLRSKGKTKITTPNSLMLVLPSGNMFFLDRVIAKHGQTLA
jgi:hypothetical protein